MTTKTDTEQERAELLPCPFCGGGETEVRDNGRPWLGMRWGDPVSVSVRHWCEPIVGQPSRMIERVGRDRAAAIAAWNRRAAPQPAEPCASSVSDKPACGSENGDCDSQPAEPNGYVGVSLRDIKVWRNEWLEANDPRDGTDCVTPFDKYLYDQPAESVKVPSDAEIGQILKEVLHNSRYGVHQWELWLEFASALFTRYGKGTP